MDDITFCLSDCQRTDCFRHPSNIHDRTIPHSYADFRETDTCPSRQLIEKMQLSKEDATKGTTFDCIDRQDAIDAHCELCGDRGKCSDICPDVEVFKLLPSAQPESRREWYMRGYRDAQNAAMHESCTDCPLYDHDRHNCPRFNTVIPRTIEEVKPRWIPVSEALPDRGKTVLITNDKGNVRCGRFRGVEFWKDDGDAYWTFKGNTVEHVLAWMPLPEPYEPQESEVKK